MTVTLLTLLVILQVAAGEYRLTCPQTLAAVEGEDVTLRCRLHPPANLSGFAFDVARERDERGNYDDVYSYRDGKDQPDDQMDRYKNRTHLNHKDLGGGNVVLTISSVNRSDSGSYQVFIGKLRAGSIVNITVGSAKKESVGETVHPGVIGGVAVAAAAAAVGVLLLLLLLLLLLVKCGVIRVGKKTEEAEARTNNFLVKYQTTPTTEEDGGPHSAAANGRVELVVQDETQSSPQP